MESFESNPQRQVCARPNDCGYEAVTAPVKTRKDHLLRGPRGCLGVCVDENNVG
jgi:hypothetical protein